MHVSALNAHVDSPSQYFKSKAQGEQAVLAEYKSAIIARPAAMYGWEDRLLQYLGTTVTHPFKRYATLGYIPMVHGGTRKFRPVYVGDVAHALKNLMVADNADAQIYELYGPQEMEYREFVRQFCEYARRKYFPLAVPHGLYRSLISVTSRINPLARITPHDVDRQLVSDRVNIDTQIGGVEYGIAGFKELGLQPQTLQSLFIRFVRHYRNEESSEAPAEFSDTSYWRQEQQMR